MRGWYGDRYNHSLASKGIRSRGFKVNCFRPIPVYRGFQINENDPIDLKDLPTNGWWTTDSRVAVLFSASPNNERLKDYLVVEALERNIERAIEEGRKPDPKWLDKWLWSVSDKERSMMDYRKYGIIFRSNLEKDDNEDIMKGNTQEYILEQEVYVNKNLEKLEVGYIDEDFELMWVRYNAIPEDILKDSNEFRNWMTRNGDTKYYKDEEEETPDGLVLSLALKLPYELTEYGLYNVKRERIEKAFSDIIEYDFWEYYCEKLPKYEGVLD